jgi:hypothetical protein
MRKCHNCKRKKLRLVTSFGGDHILGYECEHCGARKAFGDDHVPKGAWPKAQAWIEKQKIRRKAS